MKNIIISYDLHQPDRNYKAIEEAIENLGNAIKIHLSVYYVRSPKSAEEIRDILKTVIDKNDSLFVVDATNNTWAAYLEKNKLRHLHDFW